MTLFIGLISGTSVDAIDAVLCDISEDSNHSIKLLHSLNFPYPKQLQQELLNFGKSQYQGDAIDQLGQLDHQVALTFSEASHTLLQQSGYKATQIEAIGSHGQTVRHRPDNPFPFTLQIGDPSIISAQTGITTVADFRRKDMALGGQGAPFAPAFHHQFFSNQKEPRAVVNLGGIANVTLLQPEKEPIGFDTGPANTLMDQWIYQHKGKAYDLDGRWALEGKVIPQLLEVLLEEPYFKQLAPKSTGCEYFNMKWLEQQCSNINLQALPAEDVQRTLLELTILTVTDAIKQQLATNQVSTNQATNSMGKVYLCGGGAHNSALTKQIQKQLPDMVVSSTKQLGIDPDWVEAMTFAWFASKTLKQEPIQLNSITGARQNSVLGGIYLA